MTSERDRTQPGEPGPADASTPPEVPAGPTTQPATPAEPATSIAYGRAADESPTTRWTPPAYSPAADESIATAQTTATSSLPVRSRSRGSAVRWGIALLVTALIVVAGAVAVVLLTGASSPSTLLGYVPDEDSVIYAELRLDLPGDQRQKLGDFLSKFPGFADQSTLETKLDDVMDRLVRGLTEDRQDWSTKIKPWFGGELGVAVGTLPEMSNETIEEPRAIIMATVSDGARAQAWIDDILATETVTTEDYNGTSVRYLAEDSTRVAVAIVGGSILLAGDEGSVEGAIDTRGNGSFGDDEQFRAARDAMRGDSLGYLYIDFTGYAAWVADMAEEFGGVDAMGGIDFDALPDFVIARIRAESDALVLETANRHVDAPIEIENRASTIAQYAPSTTVALLDVRELGAAAVAALDGAREDPTVDQQVEEIDNMLGSFGGVEGSLEWMGDLGFLLTQDGDKVDGGLVVTTEDSAQADSLLAFVTSLASIGGSQMGAGVDVREETHGDAEITVIDFGDWRDLAELGGGSAEEIPFEGRLELAYVVTDDIVALGLGVDFIKDVLDAGSGDSLADQPEFNALLDRVGAENSQLVYFDIAAVREMLEDALQDRGDVDMAMYEAEVRPYLEPFDAFIQAGKVGGDLDRSTTFIVVNSVN